MTTGKYEEGRFCRAKAITAAGYRHRCWKLYSQHGHIHSWLPPDEAAAWLVQ
jgi:hypothetical protein